MSRTALFNAIVSVFMAFFVIFAFVLYPNHQAIHPHQLCDSLTEVGPARGARSARPARPLV